MNDTELSRPKVFFMAWDGGMGVSPSVVSALECLDEAGFDSTVIFRSPPKSCPPPPPLPDTTVLREVRPLSCVVDRTAVWILGQNKDNHQRLLFQRAMIRLWHRFRLVRTLTRPYAWFNTALDSVQFWWAGYRLLHATRRAPVIAADPPGLIVTRLVSVLRRLDIIYWSLELYFLSEARQIEWWLQKRLEVWSSQRAVKVLVQDAKRAELLCAENGLVPEVIMILPNSPRGPVLSEPTTYLHNLLKLDPSLRIVCQIGQLSEAMCSVELGSISESLPDGTCVVLHSSGKRDVAEPFIKKVVENKGSNCHLSLNPIPLNELPQLVSSCHIGLVFYRKDLGPNFDHIAGASGKLTYYLKSMVPVICVDIPGLVSVIDEYECGICVSSPTEIAGAVNEISGRYDEFRENARHCFESKFDFSLHFSSVVDAIQAL